MADPSLVPDSSQSLGEPLLAYLPMMIPNEQNQTKWSENDLKSLLQSVSITLRTKLWYTLYELGKLET